jgi:BASS family bile acid:Na+ symporter
MFIRIVQVVLAPVLLGALLNQYCNGLVQLVSPLMPFIAVATVAVLCGNAIAQNASAILSSGVLVVLSVGCLHACGFFFGYVLSRILGLDISSARTISIEVGMQVTDAEVSYHYLILHTDDLKVFISFYISNSSCLSLQNPCYLHLSLNFLSIQNSVLGVVLATKHFGNPLTAVPCAVSSICHSVYGSILAGIWRSMPPTDKGE